LSDFPLDRCPVALLPLLYHNQEDLHMERLLADSSVGPMLNAGGKNGGMGVSLAEILRDVGYTACAR